MCGCCTNCDASHVRYDLRLVRPLFRDLLAEGVEHASQRRGLRELRDRGCDAVLRFLEDFDDDVLLGRKMEVEGAATDARRLHDLVDPRSGEAVTTEDGESALPHPATRLLALEVAPTRLQRGRLQRGRL